MLSITGVSNLSASETEDDREVLAIKSNGLYLAAGVANIGAEYTIAPKWTIDVPIVYSPYTLSRTYRMRLLFVQPEGRYWLRDCMSGHFFGVHLHAGVFNVSFNKHNRYQTEKGFYGAGISYGYCLSLSERWSAEFTVGAGYAFTRYSAYRNVDNGKKNISNRPFNYFGITKLGINIEYRIELSGGIKMEEDSPW